MFKVNNKVSTIRSLYLLLLMSNVNLFYLFFSTSTVDFEDVNTSWGLSNSRCFFVLRLLQPVFGKTLVKLVIMKQWCLRNLQPECINKNCTTVIYNIYNSRKSLVNQVFDRKKDHEETRIFIAKCSTCWKIIILPYYIVAVHGYQNFKKVFL